MTKLNEKVSAEIITAMKEKNEKRKIALRSIKTSFDNLEKSTKEVSEDAQLKELQKMVKQRNESAAIYKEQNRQDLYEIETYEIEVLSEFLPKQLGESEVKEIALQTISEMGIILEDFKPQDFGKVMGSLNKKLSGQASGQLISTVLKSITQ